MTQLQVDYHKWKTDDEVKRKDAETKRMDAITKRQEALLKGSEHMHEYGYITHPDTGRNLLPEYTTLTGKDSATGLPIKDFVIGTKWDAGEGVNRQGIKHMKQATSSTNDIAQAAKAFASVLNPLGAFMR